jgi:membrane-bound lytic murein transglycosylase A
MIFVMESEMKKGILYLLVLSLLVMVSGLAGCRTRPKERRVEQLVYDRPLPPGQSALRKITDPAMIPDFTMASVNLINLREAVGNSINYMQKPSSEQFFPIDDVTHARAKASLVEFARLLDDGVTGAQLDAAIREKYDVYISIGCDDRGTVLFTGYYTPIFDGSLEESAEYRYPLYAQPGDLEKDQHGEILGRRGADGQLTAYPPRAEIESSGMLKGNEIVWLKDPFEAYIAHVQGSAKVRLMDGEIITVGYAANNGHEYQGISQKMIEDGAITRDQLNLTAMIAYFKANQQMVDKYVNLNPRYVFFRKSSGSPHGSINEPVIEMRTIATDKSIFPRASLTYINTNLPQMVGDQIITTFYDGFMLDQDTGGAIRAPGRCDVYMGTGDVAGKLAGNTYQEGKLYYLFLKEGQY